MTGTEAPTNTATKRMTDKIYIWERTCQLA